MLVEMQTRLRLHRRSQSWDSDLRELEQSERRPQFPHPRRTHVRHDALANVNTFLVLPACRAQVWPCRSAGADLNSKFQNDHGQGSVMDVGSDDDRHDCERADAIRLKF
jgi:hypothetical protein